MVSQHTLYIEIRQDVSESNLTHRGFGGWPAAELKDPARHGKQRLSTECTPPATAHAQHLAQAKVSIRVLCIASVCHAPELPCRTYKGRLQAIKKCLEKPRVADVCTGGSVRSRRAG